MSILDWFKSEPVVEEEDVIMKTKDFVIFLEKVMHEIAGNDQADWKFYDKMEKLVKELKND